MGYWRLRTVEIKNDFWSQGLILFIFFHSLKQCLQTIQVKASQKQNNIIKAWLYTDISATLTCLAVSEPCAVREPFHTPGNTLGAVFTSAEGSETKFFGFRYVLGAGCTEVYPIFCVYHPSGLNLGGRLKGCDIPRWACHLQSRGLNLGVWRFGPALWVGGGDGVENERLSSRRIWQWRHSHPVFLPKEHRPASSN